MKTEEAKQIQILNQFNQEVDSLKQNCGKIKEALILIHDDPKPHDAALEAIVRIHDQTLNLLKEKFKAEAACI